MTNNTVQAGVEILDLLMLITAFLSNADHETTIDAAQQLRVDFWGPNFLLNVFHSADEMSNPVVAFDLDNQFGDAPAKVQILTRRLLEQKFRITDFRNGQHIVLERGGTQLTMTWRIG